jgi:HEAT repeat protein
LDGPYRYYADARAVAADALGAIGRGAGAAIPALKKAEQDPQAEVRASATKALKRIGK